MLKPEADYRAAAKKACNLLLYLTYLLFKTLSKGRGFL